MAATPQPITILIAALGGRAAACWPSGWSTPRSRRGYPAQSTSIPGVAQRTGATTYYVEILPVPLAELGGRRPVLSLLPVPGCIDLLVASELLEAVRDRADGMVAPERTLVVASTRAR